MVNASLVERWLPAHGIRRVLKTDLFDEAFGEGLHPRLASLSEGVYGIDLSATTVEAARRKYPPLWAARADVRNLPFADATFDAVVSNSTLDHFDSQADIAAALRELHRVLRPGGRLIITLDNAASPVVALRNALPLSLLGRIGIVPYYVGTTLGPSGLRAALQRVGFDTLEVTAVMHSPRVLAVAVARLLDACGGRRLRRSFLCSLGSVERLEAAPTRFLTGHFVAALAVRRD